MNEISIFKNFNEVIENISIEDILELIKNGKFQKQIEELQNIKAEGNDKDYATKKKSLLAFTPSAKYSGGRKQEFLQEYSQLIILDIDKIETDLQPFKLRATKCKYTMACFVSPSGKGLKIIVKTDTNFTNHRNAFLRIQAYYEKVLQLKIDPSGKDVSRLCFFSYDADLYYNANAEIFKIDAPIVMKSDIDKLIEKIEGHRIDITGNYEDWVKIGFALENEFGENGKHYFHAISKFNPDYNAEFCNEQFSKCLKNKGSEGTTTLKTLFSIAKDYGIVINSSTLNFPKVEKAKPIENETEKVEKKAITTNKFTITEEYLKDRYDVRYNVISNKFEYKKMEDDNFVEMNENNMFIQLQKGNINISLNNLVALLKSDFVEGFHVFRDYFENLPVWDGKTDHIKILASYLITKDRERLDNHFKKWLVRTVRNAIDDFYFNKQAFVLVSLKQNSGKSTFCRFLCPPKLNDYIAESIATDKDSQIAITENILINLDELAQAGKNEINAFKSMFSKEKVKARLTYDKRPTVHARRASFMGSTDRWEFLTDENGSVRWLCFEIDSIDFDYITKVKIDLVWSQAYHLLTKTDFEYDLTTAEIKENDFVNKKFQVSSPERDLILKFVKPSDEKNGVFKTATDILEYIADRTKIILSSRVVGKELKFLGFERISSRKFTDLPVYGYFVEFIIKKDRK